ncbi:MAG: MarR family transcriptional regulator [Planctomycetota bacterium]|nr:MarR family transcriptional regulator [Planctomycetota bacterium]
MATKNLHRGSDDPPKRRLPPLLRKTWYSMNQAFRRRIASSGATPDQFTILRTLNEHEPDGLTQFELAELLASDPNTISSLLKRMTKSGLVDRKRHERDRRALRVRITSDGEKLFKELREVALDLQTQLMNAIEPERREQFLADLETIAEAANQIARQKGQTQIVPKPK